MSSKTWQFLILGIGCSLPVVVEEPTVHDQIAVPAVWRRYCKASEISIARMETVVSKNVSSGPAGGGLYSDVRFVTERSIRAAPTTWSMNLPGGNLGNKSDTVSGIPPLLAGGRFLVGFNHVARTIENTPKETRYFVAWEPLDATIALPPAAYLASLLHEACSQSPPLSR